ncbi:CCC motif membrane protein [uncultured Winogradskyella sp.]|uniref:CCC motif membrane protein n=1 Tax=uncultured Winogradskyella sp. TaxID=395353 RepID=UPI00262EA2FB|nr:CCC motif membrane protein [uncultured Winogradskyella sp.]
MNYNKLSADPLAMILGILALVIGLAGCCCYGLTAIIPLVMAIIGLVTANKSLRDFNQNPEAYSPQSRSNVNTAKIINIIAIVLNGLIVMVSVIAIAFYGTIISSAVLEEMNRTNNETDDFYDYDMETEDSDDWEDDDYILEEQVDSINIDAMEDKEPELNKKFIEGDSL